MYLSSAHTRRNTRGGHITSRADDTTQPASQAIVNIKINPDKNEFLTNKINYCGYVIDRNGLHKVQDQIKVINKMQRPQNVMEVHSFLGMINHYSHFPNLS